LKTKHYIFKEIFLSCFSIYNKKLITCK